MSGKPSAIILQEIIKPFNGKLKIFNYMQSESTSINSQKEEVYSADSNNQLSVICVESTNEIKKNVLDQMGGIEQENLYEDITPVPSVDMVDDKLLLDAESQDMSLKDILNPKHSEDTSGDVLCVKDFSSVKSKKQPSVICDESTNEIKKNVLDQMDATEENLFEDIPSIDEETLMAIDKILLDAEAQDMPLKDILNPEHSEESTSNIPELNEIKKQIMEIEQEKIFYSQKISACDALLELLYQRESLLLYNQKLYNESVKLLKKIKG